MAAGTGVREDAVFRDSRRMRSIQVACALAFVALVSLCGVGLFVPTESSSNPNGLTLTSKAIEMAVLALAATAMAWTFRGARRTRLFIGEHEVEVRNGWKTVRVPLSEVAGFVARGGTGVALLREQGSSIPVRAVSRLPGRHMEETLRQLNSAVDLGPRRRVLLESAPVRPTISVQEASQVVLDSLSSVERRWFASTAAFAIDQARRSQSRYGTAAAQGGLMSVVHRAIGAQLTVTAGALGWAMVAVETLHFSSHLALVAVVPLMIVLGGLTTGTLWGAFVENRRSGASRAVFSAGRSKDSFQLPPATGLPVPGSAWGGAMLCLWGADLVVAGWSLHTAKFVAPRATGIYFMAMGLLALALGLVDVQRVRRVTRHEERGPSR